MLVLNPVQYLKLGRRTLDAVSQARLYGLHISCNVVVLNRNTFPIHSDVTILNSGSHGSTFSYDLFFDRNP